MTWRLPAEWEPQTTVWMVWPRDPQTWPDRLEGARAAYAAAIAAIAPQHVDLVVHPDVEAEARKALTGMKHVTFWPVEHQDSWIRDYGPITLSSGRGSHQPLKFTFDAWGGKYESLQADNDVVHRLVAAGAMQPPEEVDFILEGGAVETDGKGTFLATESVAAGRNQYPEDVEEVLRKHLLAKHVIWLGDGIRGDDTDGHIDTITRFVAERTVVTVAVDRDHPDYAALHENQKRLKEAVDAKGRKLKVYTLPGAPEQWTDDGMPLPAGYANFLITNEAVLVPTFDDAADKQALAELARHFPDRRTVDIDHRDLIWGMGGIHCLSMHVPK